ncbi:PhzF family phenazine biosynthesis protein [Labrys neptuniae]|uniref:PhzF family phenazine biosynthesis protein n=1 Tax=Labrys neptuniae TaxID=376174 RepID=A0ABV3PNA0_9HYPH
MGSDVEIVSVFAAGPNGGNPAPIVIDAAGMSDADMQQVARSSGYESGFVLPPPPASNCDFELRFWVPNHEMSMCGHVTVGALWLLDRLGRLPGNELAIWTKSGRVAARIRERTERGAAVEISQPVGTVETLGDGDTAGILEVLGVGSGDLAPRPIQNASTSRVKTLVPLKSAETLNGLSPDFARIEDLCDRIGSTGLYPYAVLDGDAQIVEARQFPKASGYPEDAATGIAASALSFGLLANAMVEASERPITIRQGRAMRRPSEILVRFQLGHGRPAGCWLGGAVRLEGRDRARS